VSFSSRCRVVLGAAIACVLASQAEAFCLKNQSNKWVHVDRVQTVDGTRLKYKADILPGKELCCDWRDKSCNPTGMKDTNLHFSIYGLPDKSGASAGAWEFHLPASGRIEVVNSSKSMIEPKLFID